MLDASTLVGAAIRHGSVPEPGLFNALCLGGVSLESHRLGKLHRGVRLGIPESIDV